MANFFSGGIRLTFTGRNLNSTVSPRIQVFEDGGVYERVSKMSSKISSAICTDQFFNSYITLCKVIIFTYCRYVRGSMTPLWNAECLHCHTCVLGEARMKYYTECSTILSEWTMLQDPISTVPTLYSLQYWTLFLPRLKNQTESMSVGQRNILLFW